AGLAEVNEIKDYSAGGMPTRVKCLHALVGHSLAAGPGVNPIGDRALSIMDDVPPVAETPAGCAGPTGTAKTGNAGTTEATATTEPTDYDPTMRVAAFDCGTNSLRLLIAAV